LREPGRSTRAAARSSRSSPAAARSTSSTPSISRGSSTGSTSASGSSSATPTSSCSTSSRRPGAADAQLVARARTNTFDNFLLVFDHTFLDTIAKRVDSNDAIFKKILDEPEFRRTLLEFYATKLYERLRREDDQLGLAPTPA
jgi:hypothetical protein